MPLKKRRKAKAAKKLAPFAEVSPSKPVAVGNAVARQLQMDGRWPPNNMTKIMGADYRYDPPTMQNFLLGVGRTLATGMPAYSFQFNQPFIMRALMANVATLMAAISRNTAQAS